MNTVSATDTPQRLEASLRQASQLIAGNRHAEAIRLLEALVEHPLAGLPARSLIALAAALSGDDERARAALGTISTSRLTVAQGTTFRDNLVLDMDGAGGNVQVPANLVVQGAGGAARTLTINTQAGAAGTGILTADGLQLLGSGDQVFTAGNLIGTLAAKVDGAVTLNNAQSLAVGRVGVFGTADGENIWLDRTLKPSQPIPAGDKATVGVTSTNERVTLTATAGSITLSDFINSGTEDTLLHAVAGTVTQAAQGYVVARGLSAVAPNGVDLYLAADNDVDVVSGRTTLGGFRLRDKDGFSVGTVLSHLGPAGSNPPGQPADLKGIVAGTVVDLLADTGHITQTEAVRAIGLRALTPAGDVRLDGSRDGASPMADWNNVSDIAGRANGVFAWRDENNIKVSTISSTAGIQAGSLIDIRSQTGAITQTEAGSVMAPDLQLSAAAGVIMDTAPANSVGRLAGSTTTNDFVYRNSGNLTLDTVAQVVGVRALAGNISIESISGNLTQSASGAVRTNALRLIAATGIALDDSANNDVVTLGGLTAAGNLAYTDANDVTVAAVAVDSGRLTAAGLSAPAAGRIELISTAGLLSQTAQGPVTAGVLRALGLKGVALAHSDANDVTTLAGASVEGHFAWRDATGFTVDRVVGAKGTSPGISANATSGTVDLAAANGAIEQSVNGLINAYALRALATTGVSLATAVNDVARIAGATTAGDFRFRDAGALMVATVASTRDTSQKTVGISASTESSTIDLEAGGALSQSHGPVAANKLRLQGASVDFKDRSNQASVFAGLSSAGPLAFYAATDVTVGQVMPTSGVTASGQVDVQARGNLVLLKPVIGVGEGNEATDNAVILRAEKRFHNDTGLGADAINAIGGRWLVYDDNPLLLDKSMKGLAADREFLLVNTRYQDYPPASVWARGDGYITTAQLLEPADVVRATSGHQSMAAANNLRLAGSGSMPASVPGRSLLSGTPLASTAPGLAAASSQLPLRADVTVNAPFRLDLRPLVGNGRLTGVSAADGSAPGWVSVDAAAGQLIGTAPSSAQLQVSVLDPGQTVPRRVRINLQAR